MEQPNLFDGIIVDNFAGGGGASTGMKHIVQYSGGAGSAMAAYLVAQQVPKEDIILLFHDVRGGTTMIFTALMPMFVGF